MAASGHHFRFRSLLLPWAFVFAPAAVAAAPAVTDNYLEATHELRTRDHAQFEQRVRDLHAKTLTPAQRWRLSYLDAWDALYHGDTKGSDAQLREIIHHAGDPMLVARASALRLSLLGAEQRYPEVAELANQLAQTLPRIKDPETRYLVLYNLSQAMGIIGETDLATGYAGHLTEVRPGDDAVCMAGVLRIEALARAKRLAPGSGLIQPALDACAAARQPVSIDTINLNVANAEIDAGLASLALARLDHASPSIASGRFAYHEQGVDAERARAHLALDNLAAAKAAATAVIAQARPDDVNQSLRDAWQVLWQVAKRTGDSAAALAALEHYTTQDKAFSSDANARELARLIARQHVLTDRLESERLASENAALRIQGALERESTKAHRLTLVLLATLLLAALAVGARMLRAQRRFSRLACFDDLTGALDHQHFVREAHDLLARLAASAAPACLMYLDLDHFKRVNDSFGHPAGDAALRHVAATIRRHLRPRDLLGRMGGEEFAILLADGTPAEVRHIAERIRAAVAATPVTCDQHAITVSVSIGLAHHATGPLDFSRLAREADAALYAAKRGGRNRIAEAPQPEAPSQDLPA